MGISHHNAAETSESLPPHVAPFTSNEESETLDRPALVLIFESEFELMGALDLLSAYIDDTGATHLIVRESDLGLDGIGNE